MAITISINGETPAAVLAQMYQLLGIKPAAESAPGDAPQEVNKMPEPAEAEKPKRGRKKAEAPAESEAEETPEAAQPRTASELKAKLIELATASGDQAAPLAILNKFGAKKLSEVPADKLGEAYTLAEIALANLPAAED